MYSDGPLSERDSTLCQEDFGNETNSVLLHIIQIKADGRHPPVYNSSLETFLAPPMRGRRHQSQLLPLSLPCYPASQAVVLNT